MSRSRLSFMAEMVLAGITASRVVHGQPSAQSQTSPGPLPYVAILDPQFIPGSEAGFLQDNDIVIGVARGTLAKAFPAPGLDVGG